MDPTPAGTEPIKAPGLMKLLLEARAPFEYAASLAAAPWLLSAPRGDGHAVLVYPGFLATDFSTRPLRRLLRTLGHDVHGWEQGRNVGARTGTLERALEHLRQTHRASGRRVSLVGWSLGGVFALYGALQAPECVRHLVTLGSPVNVGPEGSQASPLVKALYRMVAHPLGAEVHVMQPRAKSLREHSLPSVPISCLYSISDGVVPPQEATIDGPDAHCENIRVSGSHTGLGFNPMVLAIVADRLALPEGQWQPFSPGGLPGAMYRLMTHAALPI